MDQINNDFIRTLREEAVRQGYTQLTPADLERLLNAVFVTRMFHLERGLAYPQTKPLSDKELTKLLYSSPD